MTSIEGSKVKGFDYVIGIFSEFNLHQVVRMHEMKLVGLTRGASQNLCNGKATKFQIHLYNLFELPTGKKLIGVLQKLDHWVIKRPLKLFLGLLPSVFIEIEINLGNFTADQINTRVNPRAVFLDGLIGLNSRNEITRALARDNCDSSP
jgi:hypothetical protein